jgi:serine protease SohB
MSKEIRFKTEIKDLNRELTKSIASKEVRRQIKAKAKNENIFVIRFNSEDKGNAFEKLERDVDMTVLNSERGDAVYMVIKSPGGSVTAYANAAQQISRLRAHGLHVTAFVDEVAASGGYMMASVCDRIVAQPFAFVGSIGVVSQVPIFEEVLNKVGIDVRVYTAGTNKRSVVPTKTPTEAQEAVFKEKLVEIHTAFKNHVLKYRPTINPEKLMEGDFYMAQDVVNEKLVDEIGDSRTAILKAFKEGFNLHQVNTDVKAKSAGLAGLVGLDAVLETAVGKFIEKMFSMSHPNETIR